MKGFAITYPQLERYALFEISKYFSNYELLDDGFIVFDVLNFSDLEKFAYYTQSAFYCGYYLDDLTNGIFDENLLSELQNKNKTKYMVDVIHPRNVSMTAQKRNDIIVDVNKRLERFGLFPDPKSSDFLVVAYISKKIHIGISINKTPLDKRSYKIYMLSRSIKGPLGFLMNVIANAFENKNVLSVFVGDGVLPIEWALFKNSISPRYFDKRILKENFLLLSGNSLEMYDTSLSLKNKIIATDTERKNLTFSERNAQLAGVLDGIKFTRLSVEDWDYKFKENEFQSIVGTLPFFNTSYSEAKIKKFFDQIFYQLEFILAPRGVFVMLSKISNFNLIADVSKKWNFSIERVPFDFRNDVEILRFINNKNKINP